MSMGVGMVIMQLLIGAVPVVLFGVLQGFLASRKNKWIGLVLPICSLIMAVIMAMNVVAVPSYDCIYTSGEAGYTTMDIYGIKDTGDRVTHFSHAKMTDLETGEVSYYPLEFDEEGNLIGGKDALLYKTSIEGMISHEDGFVGSSLSKGQMRIAHIKEYPERYAGFAGLAAVMFVPSIFYFMIYFIMRRRVKLQNAASGIEKMMIDDL